VRFLALAALILAHPALAQERPLLSPSRDVDVTYAIAGPDGPLPQRLRWGVAAGKMRVDPPSPGLFMVVDTHSHRLETVRESDHVVVQVDGPKTVPGQVGGASFKAQGSAHIAGLDCTQWQTTDTDGMPTLACITADGVLLQAVSKGQVLVVAVAVRYSAQDDAVFAVPQDYRRVIAPPVKR